MAFWLLLLPSLPAAEVREPTGIDAGAVSLHTGDTRALCQRGDAFFRNAEFERAEQSYLEAAELDPGNARAYLGLGRISRLRFRRIAAHENFDRAFRLDPHDPEILLAYSEYVSDPRVRGALYAALRGLTDFEDARILQVIAKLQMEQAVASRPLNRLASPYRAYQFKLSRYLPAGSTPYGVVLNVSLNGGKPLRLLLDSGGKGIVVSARSVRDLGLEVIAESRIGGLGAGESNVARVALARSLEAGDLKLENCPVEMTEKSIVAGADGIISTGVFQEFLLRLDTRSQVLELAPFPGHEPAENGLDSWLGRDPLPETRRAPFIPALHIGHLLAVETTVDRRGNGLFVLDTGSAYNTVSPAFLGILRQPAAGLAWRGAQGAIGTRFAASPVEFRVSGGPPLIDADVIALDFAGMSQKETVRISGLLGYSTLRRFAVTMNYRDGVVQLAPHDHR